MINKGKSAIMVFNFSKSYDFDPIFKKKRRGTEHCEK